jgi:hypothetical protein
MNSHELSELAPASLYAASTTKRLVIRQELLDDRPAVLFVVEFDHEVGSPDCDAEELLTAVTQVVQHADSLPNILCRVFTSALINGRRNFIEWSPTEDGRLLARRDIDLLPPSLVTAELLNQSLAVYGSSQQQDAVQ